MYEIDFKEDLKLFRIAPMSGPIRGNTTVKVFGTGLAASDRPLYLKFGSIGYSELNTTFLDEESFDNARYARDDIHQHPFKLKAALSRLPVIKDGRSL